MLYSTATNLISQRKVYAWSFKIQLDGENSSNVLGKMLLYLFHVVNCKCILAYDIKAIFFKIFFSNLATAGY